MSTRRTYRSHSDAFKRKVCTDVRSGIIGRREALRTYGLSANLLHLWLKDFDRGYLGEHITIEGQIEGQQLRIEELERKIQALEAMLEYRRIVDG